MGGTSRAVVLVSGRGRNLQALLAARVAGTLPLDIARVFTNRPAIPALDIAAQANVPATVLRPRGFASRAAFDAALAERIAAENPDWVVLAGYMRILDSAFVQQFAGRLVNIHPSLLPRHRGLDTHRRALAAGDARHGATVHFVTADLDAGRGILQGSIAVAAQDTPTTLADRVMQRVETRIYPQALGWLASGRVDFADGRVRMDNRPLEAPIHVDCDST